MTEQVIVNKPDYILTVSVTATPRNEELVTIRRYLEKSGWAKMELYFTNEEYEKFCEAIAENSASNARNRR